MWDQLGNLVCDCGIAFQSHGRNANVVIELVRTKGWHIYEGPTLGGEEVVHHLCPRCVGTNRSKLAAAPPPMEDDQTLF